MSKKNARTPLQHLRESVLYALDRVSPDTLKFNELAKTTGIKSASPEYETLVMVVQDLIEEGLVYKSPRRRYGRIVPQVVMDGKVVRAGYGQWLVVPEGGDRTSALQVGLRHMWTAFVGDTVRAKMIAPPGQPGGRPQGEIIRILHRAERNIVGTLKRGRAMYLDPDEPSIHRTITIAKKPANIRVGDKVLVKMLDWDDPDQDPQGVVIRTIGRAGDFHTEVDAIAARFNLPHEFPPEVRKEADAFPDTLSKTDLRGRRDFRSKTIFTIDPPDAHDFDDALSVDENDDGTLTLGIHIADVGHYVRENSALDVEARKRGTSVYLVTGVIPMLPERLSNNLCSLRPNEDRPAYSIMVRLSNRGRVQGYEITKSVIRSCRRFSYDEVLEILETGQGDYLRQLTAIDKAAQRMRHYRHTKGSADFRTTELKFILDDKKMPVEVLPRRSNRATQLVEDCMLLANRIVAEHIGKPREKGDEVQPFIYRIHDSPPKDKLVELSAFVKTMGYTLPVDNVAPLDIQKLLEWARESGKEELVTHVTLRAMAKAVYSEHNIGHFGLAFDHYTHFTSPIRRYPDLIVHRMLPEYQAGMSTQRRQFYAQSIGHLADQCSLRERAAVEAERESVKIAEVQFLKRHLGETFDAVVSSALPFGMFAELKRFGIEGLIRMRDQLRGGRQFTFDESTKSFRSTNSRHQYRIGDNVQVRVVRVDEMNAEIDLELIHED